MADNITAFLKLLRWCEHHPKEPADVDYRTMYGGGILPDLKDHPRKTVTKWGNTSSAAGAYQITVATFDEYKKKLQLPDFSAASQDKIAMAIIKAEGALTLIEAGQIENAVKKLKGRWSSLPGGKHSKLSMETVLAKFQIYKAQ